MKHKVAGAFTCSRIKKCTQTYVWTWAVDSGQLWTAATDVFIAAPRSLSYSHQTMPQRPPPCRHRTSYGPIMRKLICPYALMRSLMYCAPVHPCTNVSLCPRAFMPHVPNLTHALSQTRILAQPSPQCWMPSLSMALLALQYPRTLQCPCLGQSLQSCIPKDTDVSILILTDTGVHHGLASAHRLQRK